MHVGGGLAGCLGLEAQAAAGPGVCVSFIWDRRAGDCSVPLFWVFKVGNWGCTRVPSSWCSGCWPQGAQMGPRDTGAGTA